jgi:hypothetical protein
VIAAAVIGVAAAGALRGGGGGVAGSGDRAPALVGAPLAPGVLELPSRARVLVGEGAAAALVRDDAEGAVLRVDRGALLANVAKRAPGRPFVVVARDVRVEVVGTMFAVEVRADGEVGVRGYEGVVRVVGGGVDARVGAGEVWPSEDRAPAVDEAAKARVAFVEVAEATAAPPPEPVASAPPPRPPAPPPPARPPPQPAAAPQPPPPAPPPPPPPYIAARRLEETGSLAQALAAYRAIESGPEAEDALYAVGRLQSGVLGEPAAALATFRAYRARYPEGRYARAVDVHLLDAALARGDVAAVEREAGAFLAAHAADPLAPRFLPARAAARIQRGDCTGALADLDRLPRGPATDRLRARCAR